MLNGGAGRDRIDGGPGRDLVQDGPGDDTVTAGAGDDVVEPGAGRDLIALGTGNDSVVSTSDSERDVIDCGPGRDAVLLADANDVLRGCEIGSVVTFTAIDAPAAFRRPCHCTASGPSRAPGMPTPRRRAGATTGASGRTTSGTSPPSARSTRSRFMTLRGSAARSD